MCPISESDSGVTWSNHRKSRFTRHYAGVFPTFKCRIVNKLCKQVINRFAMMSYNDVIPDFRPVLYHVMPTLNFFRVFIFTQSDWLIKSLDLSGFPFRSWNGTDLDWVRTSTRLNTGLGSKYTR